MSKVRVSALAKEQGPPRAPERHGRVRQERQFDGGSPRGPALQREVPCRGTCCPGSTCCCSGASGPGSPFGTGCGDACSGSPRSRCACPVGTGSRRSVGTGACCPGSTGGGNPGSGGTCPRGPVGACTGRPSPGGSCRSGTGSPSSPGCTGRPRGWLRPGCTASRRAASEHSASGQQPVRAEPGDGPYPRARPPRQQPLRSEPGHAPAAEPSGWSSPRWRRCRCCRSAPRRPAPQPRHDARPLRGRSSG